MTPAVPRAGIEATAGEVLARLRGGRFEEVSHIYLVDEESRLLGQVPIERLFSADADTRLARLRGEPAVEVHPEDDAEAAALAAVERHEADVAVIDATRVLLGAIPIGRLLALLHEEHVDDWLRMGGVAATHPMPIAMDGTLAAFRARLPWLVLGLVGGWIAAGVAGAFEASLQREITLAFFLPLVVYMADAVGTQTETVLVRTLAYGNVPVWPQLIREGMLGCLIGTTIGTVAGLGLWLWGGRTVMAIVVAVTLAITALVATIVASLLPLALARIGADPALASGPIATVTQDILSVAIYLGIASWLL
jgi:magnesium transporter